MGVEINHNDGCSTTCAMCTRRNTEEPDRLLCAVWRKKKPFFRRKLFVFCFLFFQLFVTFSSCAGALIIIMRVRINNKMEQQQQQPPKKNNNLGASQYNAVFETNKRSSPKSLDREIR